VLRGGLFVVSDSSLRQVPVVTRRDTTGSK
jgi:hypothetical protein